MDDVRSRYIEAAHASRLTQDEIEDETGISISTQGKILRYPGYKGRSETVRRVCLFHREYCPSPFSSDVMMHAEAYVLVLAHLPKREWFAFLDSFEFSVLNHPKFGSRTPDAAMLLKLMSWVNSDRARASIQKKMREEASEKAAQYADEALVLLEETRGDAWGYEVEALKMRMQNFSSFFHGLDPDTRVDMPEVLEKAKSLNILQVAYSLVEASGGFNWRHARNGLIIASVFKDEQAVQGFWSTLSKSHENFEDPDYAPDKETMPLSQDPDLQWAFQVLFPKH